MDPARRAGDRAAARAPGDSAAARDPGDGAAARDSSYGAATRDPGPASAHARVRDRDVVLLAAGCVVVVLGLQLLGIVFPPFADALGRPPTMIVALVVVTLAVLGRVLWAAVRRG